MLTLALLILILCQSSLGSEEVKYSKCPKKVTSDYESKFLEIFGDSCILFVCKRNEDYATWDDALKKCKDYGGTLAMPKTEYLNDKLKSKLNELNVKSPTWIGMHSKTKDGKPVWVDDKKVKWENFASLDSFEILDEDCYTIEPSSGKWHDYFCNKKHFLSSHPHKPYVCQFSLPVLARTDDYCSPFKCDMDCWPDGFEKDQNECAKCECASGTA